jgi:hypothetical protein
MKTKTSFIRLLTLGAILTGIAINNASATLTFDLRATSLTGSGTISNGGKTVKGFASNDTITLSLYADITGTGTLGMLSTFGAVLNTIGGINGNLATPTLQAPFNASGSNAGTVVDLNGDTFTDVGTNTNNTTTGAVAPKAAAVVTTGGTAITGGQEWLLETFVFTLGASVTGADTTINYRENTSTTLSAALWTENSVALTSKGPGQPGTSTGVTALGTAVTLSAVPEPNTWGMVIGGFGTLVGIQRFRRNKATA